MTNHPNRSRASPSRNPRPAEVVAAREKVQAHFDLGVTEAQDWCAEKLHTSRRAFQQWEVGDRRMHPAFWDLFCRKVAEAME